MGNFISADNPMDKDACSGRNITFHYIANNGTLPPDYASCPYAEKILWAHHCEKGVCKGGKFDGEIDIYAEYNWDGLGNPYPEGVEPPSGGWKPRAVTNLGKHKHPYRIDERWRREKGLDGTGPTLGNDIDRRDLPTRSPLNSTSVSPCGTCGVHGNSTGPHCRVCLTERESELVWIDQEEKLEKRVEEEEGYKDGIAAIWGLRRVGKKFVA